MQEEQKTVDIDTSGPGAEIEIEENKKEEEVVEQPAEDKTYENEKETKLEDNNQSDDSSKKLDEQSNVPETKDEGSDKQSSQDKELKEYSESVQKRIAKLTKKWREAERQKDEALSYAEAQIKAKQEVENKLSKIEPNYLKTTEESIKSGLDAAKALLAKAREAGDITGEVEAQTKISELAYKQARFLEAKSQQDEFEKNKKEVKQPEINLRQTAAQGSPDPKAEQWATKNSWFGQDTAMTYTAFDLHKKLTEEEGFDPQSDEYYSEIDKRIRLEFPHKFANNEQKAETTKPVQTVASAKRSTKTSRKTVRLTPSQVAIAKKLGVPLEEYAKQLNITKEV